MATAALDEDRAHGAVGGEILALSIGLGLVLLAAKVALLPFPVSTPGEFARWTLRLAIVAAPDMCFVAGLAALAALSQRLLRSAPRLARLARPAWFLVYYLAGLYGVASVAIYHWMMVPLKLPHLFIMGGPGSMASSLEACLDWRLLTLLLLAPVGVVLTPRAASRLGRIRQAPRWGGRGACAVLLLTLAYTLVCRAYVQACWTDPNRWERRIAQSPHMVFLASCIEEISKPEGAQIAAALENVDTSDFEPSTQTPAPVAWLAQPLRKNPPKNVILIVLESTGVEYMQTYGAAQPTTPRLDRLVRERGVVVDNVYVQTPCSCKSLVALTAGVYPRTDWTLIVRDSPQFCVPTLPETLVAAGYRTCFAHSGYWSWKGRDAYLRRHGAQRLIDASDLPRDKINSWGVSDRAMYRAALDWASAGRRQPDNSDSDPAPFFLLAYTIETHHPYAPREPQRDFGVADANFNRYLNAVRGADEDIAWLIEELERRGLDESTLVLVTSDHGESFGQHNQRIHSFALYEPAVHVPLILLSPALKNLPRRRLGGVRQHIDIPATIVDALGLPAPTMWQGRSLLTEAGAQRAYFFCTGNQMTIGLREGKYKYHYYVESGHEELFDIEADPRESLNLASRHADRCAAYRRRVGGLVRYQRDFLARFGSP